LIALARMRAQARCYLRRCSPQKYSDLIFDDAPGVTLAAITTRGRKVADSVKVAATFHARRRGLLDCKLLPPNAGLLLSPGGSIHTCGLHYAIDVLFLDNRMHILKCVSCLRPWRVVFAPGRTRYVLELAAGRAAAAGIEIGTQLLWLKYRNADAAGMTAAHAGES